MRKAIIAVLGSKKSGKTTTIEALMKQLAKRGFRIGAIKHVSEPNFTIDCRGKDTWRFAQAGAETIVTVADNEVATVEKMSTKNLTMNQLSQKFKGTDVIFVEGLRDLIGKNRRVPKIVVVRSAEEASQALESFEAILAFTGPFSTVQLSPTVPYVDVFEEPEKMADLIENLIRKSKARR